MLYEFITNEEASKNLYTSLHDLLITQINTLISSYILFTSNRVSLLNYSINKLNIILYKAILFHITMRVCTTLLCLIDVYNMVLLLNSLPF